MVASLPIAPDQASRRGFPTIPDLPCWKQVRNGLCARCPSSAARTSALTRPRSYETPVPLRSLRIEIRFRFVGVQLALDAKLHLAEFVADVFAVRPGPVDGVVVKAGMMCQWQWSTVWPAARPLLMITLRPSAPVAAWIGAAEPGQERAGVRRRCLGQLAQVGMVCLGHEQRVAVD